MACCQSCRGQWLRLSEVSRSIRQTLKSKTGFCPTPPDGEEQEGLWPHRGIASLVERACIPGQDPGRGAQTGMHCNERGP